MVPELNPMLCDGCGECSSFCQFGALSSFGGPPRISTELCHSCGGCVVVCPKNALREVQRPFGWVERFRSGKIELIQGKINVGEPLSPAMIEEVLKRKADDRPAILDAPPGTSCAAVASLKECSAALLVTEPTPFGLNDLQIAVELLRMLKKPFAVVVNRMGVGDDRVHRYCEKEEIPIVLEIPDDRLVAEAYSRGELIVDALPRYQPLFDQLREWAEEQMEQVGSAARSEL